MSPRRGLALVLALAAIGCGGAQHPSSTMGDMDKVRASAAVREATSLAPQSVARAEEARKRALEAQAAGDDVAASLHAELAVAAYEHAVVLARLSRAKTDEDEASDARARAVEQMKQLSASRTAVEREVDDLDKQLKVAREAALPAPSGPGDASREAARLVAARSLAMQARLLCGAAKIVASGVEGLADAESQLAALEKQLESSPKAAPIDAAARVRAQCLALLTKARRTTSESESSTDALLAELSAAGGWDPARDERGVVVTLRGLFKGAALRSEAEAKLRDLGRVAGAHPAWGVQVVVHDATPPSQAEAAANGARAEAVVKAIVSGGAPSSKVTSELAGAKAPIVDPQDAARRGRNARVEVVFVAPR
jgi:flagellar motor protein MotB